MPREQSLDLGDGSWPDPWDVEELTITAGGQFIQRADAVIGEAPCQRASKVKVVRRHEATIRPRFRAAEPARKPNWRSDPAGSRRI